MANQRILAVDDEEHILELIEYNLIKNGFSVIKAGSGEEALEILEEESVDLVLLDIMMEGIDGIEVLRRIRSREEIKDLPVILLTAKGEEIDKVLGLELGADDYIAKPFGVHELAARIKAVLRRSGSNHQESSTMSTSKKEFVESGNLSINKETREVLIDGQAVELALKEFELLYLLVKNKGIVFSRDQVLETVWGYDYFGETRTVDVHIRNIRKKLENRGINPECIKTVRGVGYKFQPEE
ncbi:MAG: response regulator transcription factor [Lachnospiraceae bacterium]|nr:response regulator transcription factor [Lachnospiraceae bacterium]